MSQNRYGQGQSPYHQGPAAESGYSFAETGRSNARTGPNVYNASPNSAQDNFELAPYPGAAGPLAVQDFLAGVQATNNEIRALKADYQQIGVLHQRALAATDSSASRDVDDLVSRTQARNNAVRDQIGELRRDLEQTPAGSARNTKRGQLETLRSTFSRELREYQGLERDFQRRYRDQIARQYRIVNPEASESEVQQAADMNWGNEGVFQTALRGHRVGQASLVLGAVRARHNEFQRIEENIRELVALVEEVDALIEQQDSAVATIEYNTESTVDNFKKAEEEMDITKKHLQRIRRNKWRCLWVGVAIVLILIIILLIGWKVLHWFG